MKLKPIADRIIIRRREQQDKTESGIYLPDTAKNKPQYGKVLAVGPGKLQKDGKRRSMQVKEGDTVLFTSWAGDEFREHRTKDEIMSCVKKTSWLWWMSKSFARAATRVLNQQTRHSLNGR